MKLKIFYFFLFYCSTQIFYAQKTEFNFIYKIVNQIIVKENLNKNFGLIKIPFVRQQTENDKVFLNKYLIKKKIESSDKSENLITNISFPNRNILTETDVSEMMKFNINNNKLKWNNEILKFDLKNSKYQYQFSIPYVNNTKSKIIIQYELICPGLCGNGKTLLLIKKKGNWEITALENWIH